MSRDWDVWFEVSLWFGGEKHWAERHEDDDDDERMIGVSFSMCLRRSMDD